MKTMLIALSVLIITACASKPPEKPTWISQPDTVYPEKKYLSAVGQGKDQEDAKHQAIANLGRIFSVSIHEKQLDASSFSSSTGTTETNVQRHISLEAQNQLRGARVDQTFTDETGTVSAIAVLDRMSAAKDIKKQMRLLDGQVEAQLKFASTQAPNFVSALSALKLARSYQLKRENHDRDLIVLDNRGLPSKHSSAEIEKAIRASVAKLSFDVRSDDEGLKGSMQSAMTDLGIAMKTESNIKLVGELQLDPVFKENNWYWLRGNLVLNIMQNDKVLSQKRWALKQSAKQKSVAERRVQDRLNQTMTNYLIELMTTEILPSGK